MATYTTPSCLLVLPPLTHSTSHSISYYLSFHLIHSTCHYHFIIIHLSYEAGYRQYYCVHYKLYIMRQCQYMGYVILLSFFSFFYVCRILDHFPVPEYTVATSPDYIIGQLNTLTASLSFSSANCSVSSATCSASLAFSFM